MKLESRDERTLALLGTRSRSASDLAAELGVPVGNLERRLADLADNGLVYDRGGGRYERTESGRRVLLTSAGAVDERIDTSSEVERALARFELGPDEADAVRHAYAFLRYWGRVTEEELVDAIYSEAPAGRTTSDEWWDGLVSEPLAALPDVAAPEEDGEAWRYAGTPEADEPSADGRRVLSKTHPVYGDVKHALESLDLTEAEREAARAAFGYLYRRGVATDDELCRTVYPGYAAGYESPQAWWEGAIREAFEALPGVKRTGERAWQYRRP